jgi:hypothetical protein
MASREDDTEPTQETEPQLKSVVTPTSTPSMAEVTVAELGVNVMQPPVLPRGK